MEKNQNVNALGTEKISSLLAKFAIPGIISMLVNALYNIVDQIFIGRGVNYLGNGATNVIFPLSTFAMAFALMIGDGCASFMSLMLGEKEEQKAANGTCAGLVFTFASGIVIATVYLIFLKPLCIFFGATEAILPYALQYGSVICLGLPFCAVCVGYASIIRADGSPKYNMAGLLTGCIINLIGDPLFIFVFKWGVAGAAWATILGQIANAFINFAYIPRIKSVKLNKEARHKMLATLPSVLKLGISSFIAQMVLVIVMAVQNKSMMRYGALSEYGADVPISALGVTMKVFNILMVIVIGLSTGAQPIWGYNYGAKKYDRVKAAYRLVLTLSTAVMIVAFLLFQLFPMSIVSIFGTADAMYNKFAVKTLKVFLLLVPLGGFQLVTGIFFQAVGRPVQASIISLSKQILFSIPTILLLCPIFGVEGILISGPVSDFLSFLTTLALLLFSWKRIFSSGGQKTSFKGEAKNTLVLKDKYLVNGKPTVITIDRTYGAGGRETGSLLAQELHIPYYDTDIIREAADESGLNAMFLAFANENDSSSYPRTPLPSDQGRDLSTFALDDVQRAAMEAQNAVIEKVAANGSCVIVGRRADRILKGKSPVFRVFINMPLEQRVERVSLRDNISPVQAEKLIRSTDRARESAYNFASDGKWGDGRNYDLCLDVTRMGTRGAVNIIKASLQY